MWTFEEFSDKLLELVVHTRSDKLLELVVHTHLLLSLFLSE